MEVTIVKKEHLGDHHVKVEEPAEQEARTVVVQNISEYGEVQNQIISSESIPHIIESLDSPDGDGNVQILQLEDGQYTYIIENPDELEDGAQFELADGEQFVIEEYQEEYEEADDQSQLDEYENMYIQPYESSEQEIVTTEVYTISEEVEGQYAEDDDQPDDDDDDDDQQMAIVEEVEGIPQEHEQEEKPTPTIIQKEKLQVKIKQVLRKPLIAQSKNPPLSPLKPQIHPEPVGQPIKVEIQYSKQDGEREKKSQLIQAPVRDHRETIEKATDKDADQENKKVEKNNTIELIYECSLCSKTFKTPTAVKRHITVNHSKSVEETPPIKDVLSFSLCPCCGEPSDSAHTTGDFSCEQCDKLFILQNALDRHRSIEHPTGDSYECCDCKKTFLTKELLIDHNRVHSLKSVKCEDCGKEFSRKYHLERHIVQTGCMGVPKQVYECRVCKKTFTRKDNLGEHLKAHAGITNKKKRNYTCEFCMKVFSGVALLQIHIRTHTGERPYGCDICEKTFPSSGAMKKHRRKHTGEKPYTCLQCGIKFAAKETLNRHWRTHTGDKPHQCKFCGKAFIQASQLRAHIFHHTGENAYTCPHCNRAFNRKLRLTTHIKFMHEGGEPLSCPTKGCDKTFFRKEDMHRHVMTHSGEKPFKCDICEKAFVVRSSLKIHQNIHKKEQPVTCEVCSRPFIRRDCLMRHMRAKHRDVLEDILANAEKKRLQTQLFQAVSNAANKESLKDTIVWNELTLTESIKELLSLLVDEECLAEFGHPEAPVDRVLESVIRRCGHAPALETDFDYIGKMRENAKLLFTVVIDDIAVKELLNNQTVDEVIMHVLKLARKQANGTLIEDEEEIDIKPTVFCEGSENVKRTEFIADNSNPMYEDYEEDDVDNPESILTENIDGNPDDAEPEGYTTIEYLVEDSNPAEEEFEEDGEQILEAEYGVENDFEQDEMEVVNS